ncbi:DUF72 domain-containing protein [Achromobacter sp. GG226]|uniref:DUF72 domain-containing protein n=1 Tax=Verticiella alkaliphila TaxID=2779529 RepID=UPI001C0DA1CD|nr:DUF72 domain-containing protein [Verticiella sp. GG226]MBU4613090.1 DUF72 domain-containing protein [Verticiella sp. GG226]
MTECNANPRRTRPGEGSVRVGIGGWSFAPWRGTFYPEGLPQREELAHASRALGMIEINSTFYRSATPKQYATWRDATPDGFVFSVKAPRYTTQRHTLADAGESIERFVTGGVTELGDKLGPLLWQLPPSRVFDAGDLRAFLAMLPRQQHGITLRHVVEVRHASFLQREWLTLARRYGVGCVFTDSPDYPSFADPTSDVIYARLMNASERRKAGYTPRALDGWARVCRVWSQGGTPAELPRIEPAAPAPSGPRDVFILFINGYKPRAPAAALALQTRLADAGAGRTRHQKC